MKRLVKLFFASMLCSLTLASCVKPEEIENLQNQINEIKQENIASIESQIKAINSSITKLETTDKELKGYIETLQTQQTELQKADQDLSKAISDLRSELKGEISTAQANVLAELEAYKTLLNAQIQTINTTLASLQVKDQDLQTQITNLTTYVNGELQSTKDWASATFVTLEAYNTTASIVAGIQTQITTINSQIEELKKTVAGVTKEELEDAINALDESLQAKINKAVQDCSSAITQATNEITAAYTTAIQNAISASESSIKTWVNTQLSGYYTIAQVDALVSTLRTSLEGQLSSQKVYLEGLISNLETSLNNKISANKTLIDGLQGQINTLNSDLAELTGKVSANSSAISDNAKAIAQNAKNIAANASDIDACESLIAANKKLIEANDAAIKANKSAITALQNCATADEANIAANASAIAQNASAISKNAEDIATNASLIAANATAISNNAKAISDNAADIIKLGADLAAAKDEITAAYKSAISTAITNLDGKLTGEIASAVSTINSRIDSEVQTINNTIAALTARVATCEKDIKNIKNTIYTIQQDIEDIQDQISAILARIQSITYVPKYSDGRAVMTYTNNGTITPGTATFDFELKPSSTATELVKVWNSALSMQAVYTITKAAPEMVTLSVESVTADKGFITVVVNGKNLKDEFFKSQCSANVRLSISDGNNDITTDYIQMVPWTTDVISFADAAFKEYCVANFDTDHDGEISEEEALAVTEISASMLNIASLAGIEYFKNLTKIDVSFNKLTTLDLSNCTKLQTIDVSGNKIQSLNIKNLATIQSLDCSSNKLGSLDVSEAAGLKTLNCNSNEIGALVLSNNKELVELQCNNNNIASLNLKNNVKLETLYFRKNNVSVIDVTKLVALKNLDCSLNALTALNVYQNPLLETLRCSSNTLPSLSVVANTKLNLLDCSKNSLGDVDVTKNALLVDLDCSSNKLVRLDVSRNAALETVTCNDNASMAKLWVKDEAQRDALTIKKDAATTIAFNNGGIYIPDANLKKYLVANYDDDGDGEISIAESENITNVNCSGKGVVSIEGLDYCENLQVVDVSNNNISRIVLPNLQKLTTVKCYGNPLVNINLNNCTALTDLRIVSSSDNVIRNDSGGQFIFIGNYNNSTSLKFSMNSITQRIWLCDSPGLESVDLSDNNCTSIVVNNNTSMKNVLLPSSLKEYYGDKCSSLENIDVSKCLELKVLQGCNSALTFLDVTNNPLLESLEIHNNKLLSIDISKNTKLVKLTAQSNQISSLNVGNCPELKHLDVGGNKLAAINVRNNTLLEYLSVASNAEISILNVEKNTLLTNLNASNTAITDINLKANPALVDLNVSGTSLADLDVSQNAKLTSLNISNNTKLATLNYKEGLKITSGFSVGRYIVANGVKGVTFYVSGTVTKIVSIDETSTTWDYYGTLTRANSSTDGKANTAKIPNSSAVKWCKTKGSEWYLPAQEELMTIYNQKSALNTSLSKVGGTQLGTGYYWSSTEVTNSNGSAVRVNFSDGGYGTLSKNGTNSVRAVRAL